MAIKIGDNLNYAGVKPDFVRQQYATFEEMAAVRDNTMPPIYLAYCLEDKNFYKYDKDNEVDPITGKFRLFQSGGGGGGTVDTAMSDTSTNAVQNKVIKAYVDEGDTAARAYADSKASQVEEMPEASAELADKIVQYVGETDTYTQGYFYKCAETDNDVYEWVNISVQSGGGGGGGDIDTQMSDTSTNAVQNRVIKAYVDGQVSSAITEVLNTNY
ncbi:MAG: hypothetical protein IKS48_07445 [Eubacterium sp.]|nr:hypothetical protein [Eubacterium sp.]